MKKQYFIIIAILLSISFGSQSQTKFSSVNSDGVTIYYQTISPTEVEVTYNGNVYNNTDLNYYNDTINIPSSVQNNGINYSVTKIGMYSFHNDDFIKCVSIPNSVTIIDDHSFYDCDNLQKVLFSNSLTSIGYGAFNECVRFQDSIFLPNALRVIGSFAFQLVPAKYINIGNSIDSIGYGSFANCIFLKTIVCGNPIPPKTVINWDMVHTFKHCNDSITLFVPCNALAAYQASPYWDEYGHTNGNIYHFIKQCYNSTNFLNEIENELDIKLYPNPATDIIRIDGLSNVDNVIIYDFMGRMVKSKYANLDQNNMEIDIKDLKNGIYYLTVLNKDVKIFSKKLIVKK